MKIQLVCLNVRSYFTNMITKVSTKGQIVLPAEIRLRNGIEPGQEFEIQRIDRGEYRLVRRQPPANEGLVDWLLACPEKGFFVPIESESTPIHLSHRFTASHRIDAPCFPAANN